MDEKISMYGLIGLFLYGIRAVCIHVPLNLLYSPIVEHSLLDQVNRKIALFDTIPVNQMRPDTLILSLVQNHIVCS